MFNEISGTQVLKSRTPFANNISEDNTHTASSKVIDQSYVSEDVMCVNKIPTVVTERVNRQDISRKRPYMDSHGDVNDNIMRPPENKCVCIYNNNNTQVLPNSEENYASYYGNSPIHNISDVYVNISNYEASLFPFHPGGSYEGYFQKAPAVENHETHDIWNSLIDIVNDDSQAKNSGEEEYTVVQTEVEWYNPDKTRKIYSERKKKITKSVCCNLQPVIVVWCPLKQLRPDFIITTLGKYDDDLEIRDRWSLPSLTSSTGEWGGAIAEFLNEETALAAAKDLSQQSK